MLCLPAAVCRWLSFYGSTLPPHALKLPLAASASVALGRPATRFASAADGALLPPPRTPPTQPAPAPASLAHLQQHAAHQRCLEAAGLHPAAAAALMRELHHFPLLAAATPPAALSDNCRQLQRLYGPDVATLIQRFPRILLRPHDAVSRRIAELSALLHVPPQQATAVLLALPELVCARHATLAAKVAALADLLATSPQQAGRIAAQLPKLLVTSPRALHRKVEHYSMLLSCPPAALRSLLCRQPRLLQSGTRLLDERVQRIGALLGVPVEQVVRLVVAYPAVLNLTPGSMAAKLTALASLVETDEKTMQAAVLQNPRLLSLNLTSLSLKLDGLHKLAQTHPGWLRTWRECSVSVRLRALCASQAVLDRLQYMVSHGLQAANSWTYLLVMPRKLFEQKHPWFRDWQAAHAQRR